jgi:UDPglucose 6-dehydrogenase
MKIGILGVGFVGSAVSRWFEEQHHDVIEYDPPKNLMGDLRDVDVAYVCVPTPYTKNGFDDSYVRCAVATVPGNKPVVIKSTVLPGTTAKVAAECTRHRVMFNPEFLRERCAYQDFVDPERQIIGILDKSHEPEAEMLLSTLPTAPASAIVPAAVAELTKYFSNTFLSLRIAYANQMHDLCAANHIDYELVKKLAEADSRIGHGYLDVGTDGYRGYGGSCFPKDVRALIEIGRKAGAPMSILEECERYNNALLESQGERRWAL